MDCQGTHKYFVACDGTLEVLGKPHVCIVIVCTACGGSELIEHALVGQNYNHKPGRANGGQAVLNGELGRAPSHQK